MADIEEPQFNSLAERISALNAQKNFTAPTNKRPPPPPPPNRPPRLPSQTPPSSKVTSQIKTSAIPERPAKKVPPALPSRSNTATENGHPPLPNRSPAPPLPRRESEQSSPSPALPPRRPSTQSLTVGARRNSNESVRSQVSTISSLSLNQTEGRKLPPPLSQAILPPLPVSRREREASVTNKNAGTRAASTARTVRAPLLPKRSMPALPQADNVRPSLPPRLPSRPAQSPGVNAADNAPALPVRRLPPPPGKLIRTIPEVSGDNAGGTPADPSNAVPPPVPVASRPSAAQIDAVAVAKQQAATCLICRDFSGPDGTAAQYPTSVIDRNDPVGYLAHVLCSPFSSLTDKARAIFTWLHHNIDYDADGFFGIGGRKVQRGTASDTIFSGLAVCEGYARVYEAIAKRAGLECVVVGGHGKGYGFAPVKEGGSCPPRNASGHAWNAVRIDGGKWKLLDSCWGAGHISNQAYKRQFSPQQFTNSNEVFGMSHFPEDSRYFFREDGRTPSWEEYVLGPTRGERAGWSSNAIDEGISEWNSSPAEKKIAVYSGEVVRFQFAKLCEHWTAERNGKGKPKLLVMLIHGADGRVDYVPLDSDGFWWWCDIAARDLGRPGETVQLIAFDTLGGQDARGVSKAEFLSRKNNWGSMSWSVFVTWDLV